MIFPMSGRNIFVINAWRWKCGLPELDELPKTPSIDIEALRVSEWSSQFETFMRNRLIMGAIRYGKLHKPGKPIYDRVESIHKRLQLYQETGNQEYLVDIANFALLEFEEGKHPLKHFSSVDDGIHAKIKG